MTWGWRSHSFGMGVGSYSSRAAPMAAGVGRLRLWVQQTRPAGMGLVCTASG